MTIIIINFFLGGPPAQPVGTVGASLPVIIIERVLLKCR